MCCARAGEDLVMPWLVIGAVSAVSGVVGWFVGEKTNDLLVTVGLLGVAYWLIVVKRAA